MLCYCGAMARPRIHDPDDVLDVAEALAVRSGPSAVTIRAVSTATGVSNGALYHSFSSRANLLGRTWCRAAQRFLAVQTELVDAALQDSGVEAVVAAAEAPAEFAARFPDSSQLLFTVRKTDLLGNELPVETVDELASLDERLTDLMIRLAQHLWDRRDGRAVDLIAMCIVDLPTGVLLDRDRLRSPIAREHLRAAVRAVLEVGPSPRPSRNS